MTNLEYLNNLNESQKEAVSYISGPLLIVAGAEIKNFLGIRKTKRQNYI